MIHHLINQTIDLSDLSAYWRKAPGAAKSTSTPLVTTSRWMLWMLWDLGVQREGARKIWDIWTMTHSYQIHQNYSCIRYSTMQYAYLNHFYSNFVPFRVGSQDASPQGSQPSWQWPAWHDAACCDEPLPLRRRACAWWRGRTDWCSITHHHKSNKPDAYWISSTAYLGTN